MPHTVWRKFSPFSCLLEVVLMFLTKTCLPVLTPEEEFDLFGQDDQPQTLLRVRPANSGAANASQSLVAAQATVPVLGP